MAGSLPNGWLVGGLCWFILRLLGRFDDIEKAHAELNEKVDRLQKTMDAINK